MKKIIEVQQGSPEWHKFRATSFGASEASAMLGISSYKTRSQLLKEKATGLVPEVDAATQARFDRGHEYEAIARPWAEEIVGEDLYPVTLAMDIDGITLSASMDGLTMLEDVGWEHKTMNSKLAASLSEGVIPDEYHPQLEQQLLVSGAERCLFMASRGERENCKYAWYESDPTMRQRLIAGWKQFAEDLANYRPSVVAEPVRSGIAPEALPALRIEVTGMVTASNLEEFKNHALAVIGGINKDLQTDEDFADAEKTVKWLGDVEKRLDAAKEHALSQTASIDALFRAVDDIKENARRTRLDLDKLVKARKEARREEIRHAADDAFRDHIDALNDRLGRVKLPYIAADFAGAMKGKRTIASMEDAVSAELARVKIEANWVADEYQKNLRIIDTEGKGYEFLFYDIADLVTINPDHLPGIIKARIQTHKEDESARLEAEREKIRKEEEERAKKIVEAHVSAACPEGAGEVRSPEKPRVRQQAAPAKSRPTYQEIIHVLMATYQADRETVIGWLKEMNLEEAA